MLLNTDLWIIMSMEIFFLQSPSPFVYSGLIEIVLNDICWMKHGNDFNSFSWCQRTVGPRCREPAMRLQTGNTSTATIFQWICCAKGLQIFLKFTHRMPKWDLLVAVSTVKYKFKVIWKFGEIGLKCIVTTKVSFKSQALHSGLPVTGTSIIRYCACDLISFLPLQLSQNF